MEVENTEGRWEGYMDWRNRPALKGHHGGFLAAYFVLVVEVLENLAFLANASNLVLYLLEEMHFNPSKSANTVTNFMGTAFLLAIVGGFLADAFFSTYHIYLLSALIELLGLAILTVQARLPALQPPRCAPSNPTPPCKEASGGEAAMLFLGLYLVAAGVGGIKGSLPTHGAEQFDESTPQGRIHRSTFFNYYVFCLSAGGLIAVTFVVWLEDNKGWQWGFLVSTLSILVSVPVFLSGSPFYRNKIPNGSPFTTIFKVLISTTMNSCARRNSSNAVANMNASPNHAIEPTKIDFESKPVCGALECSAEEVEDVKTVLRILPIFACTVFLNCCLAQLSTFSVQQAATMNTKLGSLKIPPASLPFFPIIIIMVIAPIYDHLIIPFARGVTKTETGFSHLQRIGIGLALSIAAMGAAAVVEVKRKRIANEDGMLDSADQLPITFFWVAIQYSLLGSADLFTLAGMLEFFFTEAPASMRSLATSLSWASLAVGYYLSSLIVSIVNSVTGRGDHEPWLSGGNINRYHLERFYWLLCGLGGLNFLNYLFCACRYKYRSTGSSKYNQGEQKAELML